MARLALIPVPDRKNNVRFMIYAKKYPQGQIFIKIQKNFCDGHTHTQNKLNKRLYKNESDIRRICLKCKCAAKFSARISPLWACTVTSTVILSKVLTGPNFLINLMQYRLVAHQIGASTWCIKSWCRETYFLHEFGIFFSLMFYIFQTKNFIR